MSHGSEPSPRIELVDLIGLCRAVRHNTAEADLVVLGFGLNRLNDPVHGEDRIEVVCSHDQAVVGMLQRCCKPTADHITEHVEDHHVGVFEQMVLLEQFHRLSCDIATTTGAGRWTSALHALHTVESREHEVLRSEFLAVEVHLLENVDHGRHHLMGERERAVVLGITSDLKHPLAQL